MRLGISRGTKKEEKEVINYQKKTKRVLYNRNQVKKVYKTGMSDEFFEDF